MQELKDRIIKDGRCIGTDILKVDSFLNHQIDVELVANMGREFARLFKDCGVNKILTIEASGIPIAYATAHFMGDLPLVFAKKTTPSTMVDGVYSAEVRSFTMGTVSHVIVSEKYLGEGDTVLLIDDFLGESEGVLGFSAQREDGLRIDVAALGDGAGCGESLGDEDGAEVAEVFVGVFGGEDGFGVGEMDAAVAQFWVVEVVLLGPFACNLGDALDGFPLPLGVLYLLEHHLGDSGVFVQVVVEFVGYEVVDKFVDGDAAFLRRDVARTEFGFGLALEDGFFDIDSDGSDDAVAYVG